MRRVIAAVAALVLAALGALLVINYANQAEERAARGLATRPVIVATEEIAAGTPVSELGDRVVIREIPGSAVIAEAVSNLDDLQNLVLAAPAVPGEQLTRSRLVAPEELRARGQAELPEELANHHQVTVLLDKARALGGDIAPGDTVGVFMSFDIDSQTEGDSSEPSGDESEEGSPISGSSGQVSVTDLALHKVPVVRVEGAFVPAPASTEDSAEGVAADRVFVTLALEPDDAARLVFAAEWGRVWLSLEPEGSPDERVPSVVIRLPDRAQDVLQ